jgi:hypothetical protein
MEVDVSLQLPDQPATGIATDRVGIEWRRDADGCWSPGPCPTCSTRLTGGLSWPQLLEQRGPLTPVTGGEL